MRVSSLVALAVLVLAALYLVFLTPDWAKEGYRKMTGYGPAETPTDCVDKFLKAVKKRNLRTAATFCTGDYADLLKRGADAAGEICPVLDDLNSYMRNKGLETDKSITFIHFLDPLPPNIKVQAAPKEKGETAVGFCALENPLKGNTTNLLDLANELKSVDPRMFNRVLTPINLFAPTGFEMVKDGGSWKLKFPVPAVQVQALDFYLNNYKAYYTGLTVFLRDVNNNRYSSPQEFERELVSVLQKAKT